MRTNKKTLLITALIVLTLLVIAGASMIIFKLWNQNIPAKSHLVSQVTHKTTVLQPLPPSSPDKEKKDRATLLMNTAIKTTALSILKNCDLTPTVLKASNSATLTVKNTTSTAFTLSFTKEKKVTVNANASASVPLDFYKQAGIYPLRCNDLPTTRGYIFVTSIQK